MTSFGIHRSLCPTFDYHHDIVVLYFRFLLARSGCNQSVNDSLRELWPKHNGMLWWHSAFATLRNMPQHAGKVHLSQIGCAVTQGLVLMQTICVCWCSGHLRNEWRSPSEYVAILSFITKMLVSQHYTRSFTVYQIKSLLVLTHLGVIIIYHDVLVLLFKWFSFSQ